MENIVKVVNEKKFTTNKVTLDNRNKLVVSGVEKAISSNSESIVLQVSGSKMYLTGSGLHIDRLDVESGVVEAQGEFDSFRFGDSKSKGNFFRRMFR
ncbi:MAG: YabP/YqfC family sporulation protein [Clostridia bacterium]|nr:YabP/YqfC family sporulation protein [Clostridia bacterium]